MLVSRTSPVSVPVGGGTGIRRRARREDIAVVDLQALKLDGISVTEDWVELGAMATLNSIANHADIIGAIHDAIQLEGTANTRNQATLGGRLVAFDGRSTLITVLLAIDAISIWDEEHREVSLGEWLALPENKPGKLLLAIKIDRRVTLAMEVVNRTRLDLPIICVAAAKWKSGRIRVTVGGYGKCPRMAFDGPGSEGAQLAVENVCRIAEDAHGSSDYRKAMAVILTSRCLDKLQR
jgi:putative selenate reductase FAD-binding subunit